ncbi:MULTISPECIES: hypothetical protein [Mumia]|uniref:WXG100-like domain-containing protein n=1 Tax=Mumia TaxID=1546255 RepID=UPI001423E375|nr:MULTISPECIES: hypothetical protein [unclassified Mumia]QMW65702.1 hypothetical protein H4N58_16225 [Mumia sp. ZJ1417]
MGRRKDWSPLRDSDPTPGDPYDVRKLAADLRGTADAIDAAVKALDKIHDSATAWESDSGREFKEKTRETSDTIKKAYERYDKVSSALSTYATTLDTLQDEADAVMTRAITVQAEIDDAERRVDTAGEDEQSTADKDLQAAEDKLGPLRTQLEEIHGDWDRAGNTAKNSIDEVLGSDGLKDSTWDNVAGFLKGLADIMGTLSAILGVLAAICAVIPFLQPFAALFGALALLTGLVSLLANVALLAGGKGSWENVIWDAVGVLSFGAGRAFTSASRSLVAAARGLAKPAYIKSLRTAGVSARSANRQASRLRVTQGGREAKVLGRQFENGQLSWKPRASDWKQVFSNPFKDVANLKFANYGLPRDIAALPLVSSALRQSRYVAAGAYGVGAIGSMADLKQINESFGGQPSPVER